MYHHWLVTTLDTWTTNTSCLTSEPPSWTKISTWSKTRFSFSSMWRWRYCLQCWAIALYYSFCIWYKWSALNTNVYLFRYIFLSNISQNKSTWIYWHTFKFLKSRWNACQAEKSCLIQIGMRNLLTNLFDLLLCIMSHPIKVDVCNRVQQLFLFFFGSRRASKGRILGSRIPASLKKNTDIFDHFW